MKSYNWRSLHSITPSLDRVPFSLPASALIALYSYHQNRQILGNQLRFLDHVKSKPWLKYFLTFVLIKTINRFLSRLARNNGRYLADRPKWSRIKGKGDVVLITGGSTGIGKEIVDILAKKTNKIVVLDMVEPTYKASGVHFFKCDITNPEAIKEVAQKVRAQVGHPTIIVNNAGILMSASLLKASMSSMNKVYQVNVLGAHNILREFLPHLIAINRGHVLTTASSAAYESVAEFGAYSCSKSAALALHETLRAELVHRYKAPRVRVSIVCPTKVATALGGFLSDQKLPFLLPTISPVWLADKMVNTIESGLSEHLVVPHFASVLPALRCLPEWFRWFFEATGTVHSMTSEETATQAEKSYTFARRSFGDPTS